ncbi:MAG TPA: hypothetical protein DEA94_08280 [Rhodobacteraceae bacterium]|nr:hypothetical protein [Paracoccaceae bacterium]
MAARTRGVYAKIAVLRKIICNRAASIIFCADYQCLKKNRQIRRCRRKLCATNCACAAARW